MGTSSSKNAASSQSAAQKVPVVEVTCCTAHEYVAARIQEHGDKVAQVDAATGEAVTFSTILERSAALAAGLSARGLRPGVSALVIGENSVHYPWVLLGVMRTGAAAHLVDPRSTAREVEHAANISKPRLALVSAAVAEQRDVVRALRTAVGGVLVWGSGSGSGSGSGRAEDGHDLPDGVASLERLLVSPAKSAASVPCSPAGPSGGDEAAAPTPQDARASGLTMPAVPPPTPTSLTATFGDSCSPSSATSPLQTILHTAVDGVPQAQAQARSAPQEPEGGASVALILPSSGSTGMPKGVMVSHDNLLAALDLGSIFIQDGDVVAGLSPYFHAYGGVLMLMALCAGVPMVAVSRFSMAALLAAVKEHKITVMHVVSSLLVSLCKLPAEALGELASLRRLWSGAAQVSPLVQSALQSRLPGVTLHHSYGMTETTFTTFCGEVRADKPGSPGTLVKGMECKVVDPESHKPLAMGVRGELCFKGPMVTRGYLGNAEATAEAFDADGWLRSGDLGFVDEDGYYYVVERLKDVLKYNGHQVSPSELEALLITHPAVSEAAVIGEPHEYGEAPRALVRLADGVHVTEEELCQFISAKVAPHKQLRGGITFMTAPFPRTASGKLQRKKLRALLQDPDDSFTSSSVCSDPDPAPASPSSATEALAEAAPEPEPEPRAAEPSAAPVSASEQLIEAEAEANAVAAACVTGLTAEEDCPDTPEARAARGAAMSPEPQTQPPVSDPTYRPSLASVTSLSTIYSESPVTTPPVMDDSALSGTDDALATPAAVTRLREAAQVPLPTSEPNSPAAPVFPILENTFVLKSEGTPGSLGSEDMDIASPTELAPPTSLGSLQQQTAHSPA